MSHLAAVLRVIDAFLTSCLLQSSQVSFSESELGQIDTQRLSSVILIRHDSEVGLGAIMMSRAEGLIAGLHRGVEGLSAGGPAVTLIACGGSFQRLMMRPSGLWAESCMHETFGFVGGRLCY